MNEPVWLTVRGVFRSDIPQKYASLTPKTMTDDTLTAMFQQDIAYSLCSAVLVSEDFYDAHADQFRREWSDTEELGRYLDTPLYVELSSQDVEEAMSVMQIAGYGETEKAALPYVLWTDGAKQTLADDEILLSTRDFLNTLDNIFRSYADRNTDEYRQAYDAALDEYVALHRNDADALQFYRQQYEEYLAQYLEWDYTQEEAESSAAESAENDLRYYLFEVGGYDYAEQKADDEVSGVDGLQTVLDLFWQAGQGGTFSDAEMDRIISALTPMLERAAADGLIDTSVPVRTEGGSSLGTFRVAGFIFPGDIYVDALFSQSTFDTLAEEYGNPYYSVTETNYIPAEGEKYNAVFLLSPDRTALSAVVEELGRYGEDDTNVRLLSSLSSPLDNVNQMIDMLSQVFLWVGVVMAVFSMLLLFNFISVSITNKKREIGILRAVGARSADVFRIFFSESAIISAVCFVLSVIASIVVCGVLNNVLAADLGASIFVFGPLSVLALLGIAVVTSFIATFLPVYGIAKKKPVESIRAL